MIHSFNLKNVNIAQDETVRVFFNNKQRWNTERLKESIETNSSVFLFLDATNHNRQTKWQQSEFYYLLPKIISSHHRQFVRNFTSQK